MPCPGEEPIHLVVHENWQARKETHT
jgi:hypothetical protein